MFLRKYTDYAYMIGTLTIIGLFTPSHSRLYVPYKTSISQNVIRLFVKYTITSTYIKVADNKLNFDCRDYYFLSVTNIFLINYL